MSLSTCAQKASSYSQKPKAWNIVRPLPPGLCQGLSSSVDSGAKRSNGSSVSLTQLRSPQTLSQRPRACRARVTHTVTIGGKRFSRGHPHKVSLSVYKMWSPFIVQRGTQTRHSHRSHQGTQEERPRAALRAGILRGLRTTAIL